MSIIGGNIRTIIKNKGLKQSYVATVAGYKTNEFSNMLCGRKNIYDVDILKISSALGVTPNELFAFNNEKIKEN